MATTAPSFLWVIESVLFTHTKKLGYLLEKLDIELLLSTKSKSYISTNKLTVNKIK